MLERRSFIKAVGLLFAAPAIVRAASIMPVKAFSLRDITTYVPDQDIARLDVLYGQMPIRAEWSEARIQEIIRQSVHLFKNTNQFLHTLDEQYEFAADGASIGSTVRLPNDYMVVNGPAPGTNPTIFKAPDLSIPEMATVGTAAVLAKNPAISRRFWAST